MSHNVHNVFSWLSQDHGNSKCSTVGENFWSSKHSLGDISLIGTSCLGKKWLNN